MQISSKSVRAALLCLALALAAFASGPRVASAACVNGSNQWVPLWGTCCSHGTQKYKGQSCIFGSWVDNGAVSCSGPCLEA